MIFMIANSQKLIKNQRPKPKAKRVFVLELKNKTRNPTSWWYYLLANQLYLKICSRYAIQME